MKYFIKFVLLLVILFHFSCQEKEPVGIESKDLFPPVSDHSMQPYLFSMDRALLMSWTEKESDSMYVLYHSKWMDGHWTPKSEIARGGDWFVNWADFPAISGYEHNLISHYLKKSDKETFSYDIFLKQSVDEGKNWAIEQKLHSDSTKTEHGFVSFIPSGKDSFFVTWLDGRNTKHTTHGDSHGGEGAMQIRAAELMPNGEIINDSTLDSRTCDCCQTSIGMTNDGPLVVYRDRSEEEVRDIYFSKFKEGEWSKPKPIYSDNWKINGCPVNGPKVSVNGHTVSVAWFTAANNSPKVKVSFSSDDGDSFDQPIQIDQSKPIGRVDIQLLNENIAVLSWMESGDEEAVLKIAKINSEGEVLKIINLGEISASRASGFPQMEVLGDSIYMAWNNIVNDESKVKVKRFSLNSLH